MPIFLGLLSSVIISLTLTLKEGKAEGLPEAPSFGSSKAYDEQTPLQKASYHLSFIIPTLIDPSRFFHDAHHGLIKLHLKGLQEKAHALRFDSPSPLNHPVLEHVYPHLDRDVELVIELFDNDEKRLAHRLLQKNVALCFDCHSRLPEDLSEINFHRPHELESWDSIKKADYFTLSKNFSKAIRYYDAAVKSSFTGDRVDLNYHSFQRLMAIFIRFQQPSVYLSMMQQSFRDRSELPLKTRKLLDAWQTAANDWQDDKSFPRTRRAQLAKLKDLFAAGLLKEEQSPNSGSVELLRAHALALELLNGAIQDQVFAESLYLAAFITASIEAIHIGPSASSLFESCIRFAAHTPEAGHCLRGVDREYLELAQLSQRRGLPQDLSTRLRNLAQLAMEKP